MIRTSLAVSVLFSLSLAPILSFAGQSEIDYQVEQVKGLLKLPPGSSLSISEKILNRLGDRISIALMKIYTEQELANPANLRRYLPMINEAFQSLRIVPPDDREPRVTLVLLKLVEAQVQDPQLLGEILKTKAVVQKPTETGYSVNEVKELLKLSPGNPTGDAEKVLGRLGDRFSIALMKIYTCCELENPENIRRYLPMIVNAFRSSNLIAAEDREPRVTLILLKFLEKHVQDPQLRTDIVNTQGMLQKVTVNRAATRQQR